MWKDPWWSFKGSRIFEEMNKEFAEAEEMMNRMLGTVHEISPSDVAAKLSVLLWLPNNNGS